LICWFVTQSVAANAAFPMSEPMQETITVPAGIRELLSDFAPSWVRYRPVL
jgi:hypothetical protein